jgi:hypothetical protein
VKSKGGLRFMRYVICGLSVGSSKLGSDELVFSITDVRFLGEKKLFLLHRTERQIDV